MSKAPKQSTGPTIGETGGNASMEALDKAADAHRDAVFKNLIDGAATGKIVFLRKSSNAPRNSHP